MHDIWNPWHGCRKISEGCDNCYMYFLDKMRGKNGADIYRTKAGFDYPLHKDRKGQYKVRSGEMLRVCMTSDFFLEDADPWRADAWEIMRLRSDVIFFLLTKRPDRVLKVLPDNWGSGWDNIFFNVTCENQRRADERIPIMLELPFKHKGVMCAPFIGSIDMEKYLAQGQIEQVLCGGENYDGARPCDFEWVISLRRQCEKYNVNFCFTETGTYFIKNKRLYNMPKKSTQSEMAYKSDMSFTAGPISFYLTDSWGEEIPDDIMYVPEYSENCMKCGSRTICNGCSHCGRC